MLLLAIPLMVAVAVLAVAWGYATSWAIRPRRLVVVVVVVIGSYFMLSTIAVSFRQKQAAAFPSRLHVAAGRLLDENNHDVGVLRGFNVHVAATPSDTGFVWSQADYTAMSAIGTKLVRHIVHWDAFEQQPGVVNPTAIASLDTAIARARAAGIYTTLSIHLNVGREPAWARTTGNELSDYMAHGRTLTQYLAKRYKDEKAVIGLNINEPPVVSLDTILNDYVAMVPWWQASAPLWPVWVAPSAYGNGTPYPSSGTQVSTARLKALDTQNRGVIVEWHDYLNAAGSNGTYQSNGEIAPIQQSSSFTAQFQGRGGNYNYPNTAQTRTDFANAIAPHSKLVATSGTFTLAIGEFGMDNMLSGEPAFVADKATAYRTSNATIELWWNYDTTGNTTNNPWAARPNGTWRPSIVQWMKTAP